MATQPTSPNLELAFDVGHSSLGWAVLQSSPSSISHSLSPTLLGCGVVTFGADDCLASKRRLFRRQRRHARSTRQRIARLEKLLEHLGVLSAEQLAAKHQPAGGHSAPWLLAARVLASKGDAKHLLTWSELWDVLRWYAHNRGYDGNKRWSAAEADSEAAQEDSEKEQNARSLMEKFETSTMAETFCRHLGLDPLGDQQASVIRFKGLNAAFPRESVEAEVRRLLQAHVGTLPKVDSQFEQTLFDKWEAIPCPDIKLPKRFQGGLLFGQLVPRFDNRIISKCPVTGQKVPSRNCPEFFRFRWAMLLANIKIATAGDKELRKLTVEERKAIHEFMLREGALTEAGIKKLVRSVTGCVRDKLDQMFMEEVKAKEALVLDPAQKLVTSDKLKTLWPLLPVRIQKRARGQWRRSKTLTLEKLRAQTLQLGESVDAFDAEVQRLFDTANTKTSRKQGQLTRESLLKGPLKIERLSGRAAFARHLLQQAHVEVMAGNHPKEEGGCLFVTEQMRAAQLLRSLADQTNNHLVRHRLLILQRLLRDLVADPAFANGDQSRIAQVTIEVNRDLREMSGKTAKAIAQDLGLRLSNHKHVSAKLEADFEGKDVAMTAGLIRKARIADDLGWACPYTGQSYDAFDLITRKVDKDHVIPRSQRPADGLDSLVVTFSEVNRMKGQRTAFQFIQEFEGQPVPGLPNLSLVTLARFKETVEKLESWKGHDDDKRRKKKRKELLLLPRYEEKGFVPRDLTVTSQLVRLGAQVIQGFFTSGRAAPEAGLPRIISLPGAVTGAVRKGWRVLGCLAQAAPQILDEHGDTKTKTDIRNLTHLHHALDACVLALAAHSFPNNGALWEAMVVRSPSAQQKQRLHATGFYEFDQHDKPQFKELPAELKNQIAARLAEKRVVQHIPADMSGMKAEENTRGVVKVEKGRVYLRQRTRDAKTGKISVKETDEVVGKVVGLEPRGGSGKLTPMKGVRVIADNFGVAILDQVTNPEDKFIILPWHKVWHRLGELKAKNGGKAPRVLRNGMLIRIGKFRVLKPTRILENSVWAVDSVGDFDGVIKVDLKPCDTVRTRYDVPDPNDPAGRKTKKATTPGCKLSTDLARVVEGGLEILKPSLCGVAQAAPASAPA